MPASSTKYVFVDWAGDPGFRFRHGSSSHLVVAAVFTGRYDVIQHRLRDLRHQRRVGVCFHFRYADASRGLRFAVCAALMGMPFTARVVVVDKAVLPDSWRRLGGWRTIERFVAEAVIGADREFVENAVLIFDGPKRETGTIRGIRIALSRLFEKRGLDYRLKKVTARPADEEDGLQVADMIAGMALHEATGRLHRYCRR